MEKINVPTPSEKLSVVWRDVNEAFGVLKKNIYNEMIETSEICEKWLELAQCVHRNPVEFDEFCSTSFDIKRDI